MLILAALLAGFNLSLIHILLNAQLKKGVITNNFLRGDDYTREIANGLYIHCLFYTSNIFTLP